MSNPESKTPGLFPIGGVVRLAKRKRVLDGLSFVLVLPLLAAVFADMAGGPGSEPPDWVVKNLGYWVGAFFVVGYFRWRWLRCPDCGKGFGLGRSGRMFSPLPAACGECGCVLSPVVEALKGKSVPRDSSGPADRPPVRVGLIAGLAVVAGGLAAWVRSLGGPAEPSPPVLGLFVAGFVLFFGFAARRRVGQGRMCVACGRMGAGVKFCEHCGAMRTGVSD